MTEFLFNNDVYSLDAPLPYPHNSPNSPSSTKESSTCTDHPSNVFVKALMRAQGVITKRAMIGSIWPLLEFWKDLVAADRKTLNQFVQPSLEKSLKEKKSRSVTQRISTGRCWTVWLTRPQVSEQDRWCNTITYQVYRSNHYQRRGTDLSALDLDLAIFPDYSTADQSTCRWSWYCEWTRGQVLFVTLRCLLTRLRHCSPSLVTCWLSTVRWSNVWDRKS